MNESMKKSNDVINHASISKWIRKIKYNNLSQEKLAEKLRMTQQEISKVERGHRVFNNNELERLSDFADQDIESILIEIKNIDESDNYLEYCRVYNSLLKDRSQVRMGLVEKCKLVQTTRIGLPSSPPWDMALDAPLNAKMFERIKKGMVYKSVEMFYSRERIAEVTYIFEELKSIGCQSNYQVRHLPISIANDSKVWYPRLNVSIFDKTVALMGGMHKGRPDDHEPFIAFYGRDAVKFTEFYWNLLWGSGEDLTSSMNYKKEANKLFNNLDGNSDESLDDFIKKLKLNSKIWMPHP